jgi:hypothetical protein
MKSLFLLCIFALLAIAPSIAAFAGSMNSGNIASSKKFGRSYVKVGMGRNNRPAKSQEEDLELTLAIIMKHIKSTDEMVNDVDDSDDGDDSQTEVKVATPFTVGSSAGEEENSAQPLLEWAKMSKIKSLGTKIKDTLKSRLGKDE